MPCKDGAHESDAFNSYGHLGVGECCGTCTKEVQLREIETGEVIQQAGVGEDVRN